MKVRIHFIGKARGSITIDADNLDDAKQIAKMKSNADIESDMGGDYKIDWNIIDEIEKVEQ